MRNELTRAPRHSRIARSIAAGVLLAGERWRKELRSTAIAGAVVSILVSLGLASVASAATPISLIVPQGTAFSYLGHSCGGIQEQAYATGWDASGYPTGVVYLSTRCGGSGRGGGYHTTTYAASIAVTWDFGGNVRSTAAITGTTTTNPTFSATDANGDQLYNSSAHAYLVVPPPGMPKVVGAVQVGDQFQVSWMTPLANPRVITASTITATAVNSSAPALTATVSGAATTGLIGPLWPATSYQITVVILDAGGSSAPSSVFLASSQSASIPPSAPSGVAAHWTAPGDPGDMLVASWAAAAPGNSPIDEYKITIVGSDGGGTFTQTVSGSTLTASFSVSDNPDWAITVQAHNAAGWGPASTRIVLGGA